MLMRTDPFRELDRVAQQVFGTNARPAAMPIDAFRRGEEFVVQFDLPGVATDSIELTVERNVLTVHADRRRADDDDVELLIGERPQGTFSRQLFLAETFDTERLAAEYDRRRADRSAPGQGAGQAPPCQRDRRSVERGRRSTPRRRTARRTTSASSEPSAHARERSRPGGVRDAAAARPRRSDTVPRRRRPAVHRRPGRRHARGADRRSCAGSTPRARSPRVGHPAGNAGTAVTRSTASTPSTC